MFLGSCATALGAPPLVAHFPLDSDGNSSDGEYEAALAEDVDFGEPGARPHTGTSASFNGSSSRIQHDWNSDLNPESFTLALWAKSNGGAGAWNSPVTSRHDLFNDGERSQGYLIYDSQPSGSWTFWSGNGDDPGNWQTLDGPEVKLGEWQHVAITYDDAEEVKRLFVDGELVAEMDDTITPNDTTPFNIGAGQDNGDGFWFDGEIDDIGLWSGALTVEEINTLINVGVATFAAAPDLEIDFNGPLPDGVEISGDAVVYDEDGVDDSGYLSITDALNSQSGKIVFPDLLEGASVKSFDFSADVRVGGGSVPNPADGFSINLVRPDDPTLAGPGGWNGVPEEGTQTGLSIGFDEWDSGGGELVGFSVHVDGEVVTEVEASTRNGEADDPESLQTGPDPDSLTWQPFRVELADDGKVSIWWKGEKVLDGFQANFSPGPVQIVMGGRTGGANSNHHVDNIALSINPLDIAVVSNRECSTAGLLLEITNSEESTVDKNTIALKVDGTDVTPVVTDIDGGVRITYSPEGGWLPSQMHTYDLTAKDTLGNDIIGTGANECMLDEPYLPYLTPLPGPGGEAGKWGVRYIWGTGTQVNHTDIAVDWILRAEDDDFEGVFYDTTLEVANHGDNLSRGIFQPDLPYPEEVEFDEDGLWSGEDFVILYKGTIRIVDGGDYTFGVHSDDGFALRIFDAQFTSENGNGQIDEVSPDTLIHPAPTGDSNTRGVVNLAPGDYNVEFFWYERGGGDHGELYADKGVFATDGDSQDWALIGFVNENSEDVAVPGVTSAGWSVLTSDPGGDELQSNADGLDDIEATAGDPTNADSINYNDPQSGGPGDIPGDIPFPKDTPADDNDYAVLATAMLVVPKTGTYEIGFRGDDGSYLKIEGAEFTEIITNQTGNSVGDGSDTIECDCLTGNSKTVATVDLEAGKEYPIEAFFFERGGGSYFEVFGNEAGGGKSFLIAKDGAGFAPGPGSGLPLVGPAGDVFQITGITKEGNSATITWDSKADATYTIEKAVDGLTSDDFEEITDGYDSQGESTSFTDEAATERSAYYRVKEEE